MGKNTLAKKVMLAFPELLTLVLVIGKMIGLFPFSWWIVFLPVIIQWAVVCFMVILFLLLTRMLTGMSK